ncbi:MAG: XdhC family protein [Oscillibacter sp.]|nr:XdhC family protein [Oscillibacter sp.]
MREFWRQLAGELESGRDAELVSILASAGSTPRGAGAVMAVFADGRSIGTIGGGNAEYDAQRLAVELLNARQDAVRELRFVPGDPASMGMVCGGDVTVQFQYLSGAEKQIALIRDLTESFGRNLDTWLIRRLEGGRVTAMGLADRNGARHLTEELPERILQNQAVLQDSWFAIPVVRAGKVYVFGGGHVSQALVPALAAVGFRVAVYDDRPEFADPALFPAAETVYCGDFTRLADQVTVTEDDYVVVMTRGHQADYEVLVQVLRSGARYIGCIGSRRKLAHCRERILAAGFTAEEHDRMHAPIGLDIGAETPEEIAVSVTAELIAVRAGKLK